MEVNGLCTIHWGNKMVEEINTEKKVSEEIITATIYCVNTNCAYVYELLHGDIVCEKKISMKA
jgi:hypothetical protein